MKQFIFVVKPKEICVYCAEKSRGGYAFTPYYEHGDQTRGYVLQREIDDAFWQWFEENAAIRTRDEFRCCVLVAPGEDELATRLQQSARAHQPPFRMMEGRDNAWEDACLRAFVTQELHETAKDIHADDVETEAHVWRLTGLPDGLELKHVSTFQIKAQKKTEVPKHAAEKPQVPNEQEHRRVVQRPSNSVTPPKPAESIKKPPAMKTAEEPLAVPAACNKPKEQLPPCPPEIFKAYAQEQTAGQCDEVDLS